MSESVKIIQQSQRLASAHSIEAEEENRMELITANVFCSDNSAGGNPCAIIDNANNLTPETMQPMATRLNLPETIFILQKKDRYILRFFATKGELPLCCHGTLGAVFYLTHQKGTRFSSLDSYNGINIRTACTATTASMFVAKGQLIKTPIKLSEVAQLLNLDVAQIDSSQACVVASIGSPKLLVPIQNRKRLFEIKPNNDLIIEWCRKNKINGLYIYSTDTIDPQADFVARNFNPLFSDQEDIATGVAAASLCQAQLLMANQSTGNFIVEQGYNLEKPSKIQISVSQDDIEISGNVTLCVSHINESS